MMAPSSHKKVAKKKQQQQQQQMIATAKSTPGWIDGSHGDDGGTVISEITSDYTAFTGRVYGEDAIDDLLFCLQEVVGDRDSTTTPPPASTKNFFPSRSAMVAKPDDGSFTDKPSSKSNSTSTDQTSKAAPAKAKSLKAATTKPKAPPADLAKEAAQKAVKMRAKRAASIKTTPSVKEASVAAPPSLKAAPAIPAAAAASITTKRSTTPTTMTTDTKKTPHPAMDVSPQVKKTKHLSGCTSPKLAATPNLQPAPKTPPSVLRSTKVVTPNSGSPKSTGLSELSKQLRVQRAKNEWQHNEIARLERQLRILSDLKGVSVADLRFSLESACQEEAHDELRNQVQSLQAQLEAVQTQRTNSLRGSTANTEATQAKIATLLLKCGELEELEEAKQQEIQTLYQQLQQQKARATTLEATSAQQKARLDKFEQVAKLYIKDLKDIQADRDAYKEQVAELKQQMEDLQAQRKLDAEMRAIEAQLEAEQKKKQDYLAQARWNRAQGGASVNTGLSQVQLAALQSMGQESVADASTIATSVVDVDDCQTYMSHSVVTGTREFAGVDDDDDVSHLGDDMDMSVHTVDALMAEGLSEEQAKEALAKDAKITSLYGELREQATKASQLQTLCANQKAQLDRFADDLNLKESTLRSTQSNYDFAKTEHDSLYKRFCDIELQLTLEQEKVEGLERQLNSRTHESNLRNDQYKCRFQVQNERITDLEQQQQSLYTAFELLQQDVRAQDTEHDNLKASLDEADHQVARQLCESEKKDHRGRRGSDHESPASPNNTSQRNLFADASSRSLMMEDTVSPVATTTPVPTQVAAYAEMSVYAENSTSSIFGNVEQTPQQQSIDHPMRQYGYLWKLDKIKGWKRRFFVLYGEGGVYQMTYSDGPSERVKGTITNITMGVSTVAETNKSIKKPFSFVLHVDPLQHNAQVLYAAALTASDFQKWITALKAATIHPEDE